MIIRTIIIKYFLHDLAFPECIFLNMLLLLYFGKPKGGGDIHLCALPLSNGPEFLKIP